MAALQMVLSGPPMMGKLIGAVALAIGLVSIAAWPDPTAISATIVGLGLAWRLLQIKLFIDGDDIVIQNIEQSTRVPIASANATYGSSNASRLAAMPETFYIPDDAIPGLPDHTNKTKTNIIRIHDEGTRKAVRVDCSLGIVPAKQHELYEKIRAEIDKRRA